MTWDEDARTRGAVLGAVLAWARTHPDEGLPFEEVPGLDAAFTGPHDLVLALQERWGQAMWSRMQLLMPRRSALDPLAAGRRAWEDCARAEPELRHLLDCSSAEFVTSLRRIIGSAQPALLGDYDTGYVA